MKRSSACSIPRAPQEVDAHQEDLRKFQNEAEKGEDPQLKEFAKKHVPILEKHLELVEKTGKQVGQQRRRRRPSKLHLARSGYGS
jgi:hypothetical protein